MNFRSPFSSQRKLRISSGNRASATGTRPKLLQCGPWRRKENCSRTSSGGRLLASCPSYLTISPTGSRMPTGDGASCRFSIGKLVSFTTTAFAAHLAMKQPRWPRSGKIHRRVPQNRPVFLSRNHEGISRILSQSLGHHWRSPTPSPTTFQAVGFVRLRASPNETTTDSRSGISVSGQKIKRPRFLGWKNQRPTSGFPNIIGVFGRGPHPFGAARVCSLSPCARLELRSHPPHPPNRAAIWLLR